MLVSRMTEKVNIPHEDGQWMEFRRLPWTEMQEARDSQQEQQLVQIQRMGGDVFAAIMNAPRDQKDKDKSRSQEDKLENYDRQMLLEKAIMAWSYEEGASAETIKALDARTARWAAEWIFNRNREYTQEEQGNA